MTDWFNEYLKEQQKNTELRKEVERLREALKIFAIYADYLDENYGDHPDHYVSKGFRGEIITFGDFRKARSALQQKESE